MNKKEKEKKKIFLDILKLPFDSSKAFYSDNIYIRLSNWESFTTEEILIVYCKSYLILILWEKVRFSLAFKKFHFLDLAKSIRISIIHCC